MMDGLANNRPKGLRYKDWFCTSTARGVDAIFTPLQICTEINNHCTCLKIMLILPSSQKLKVFLKQFMISALTFSRPSFQQPQTK